MVYSDINFILLGEIVHRLTGKMLNEVARDTVYQPLGMHETTFLPPDSLRPRIAPTEINPVTGQPLRGEVHDDTARYMGGVAGHAGVFTTAGDLAKFAQMMLDEGEGNGTRLFSAATVQKFTTPQSPADQPILRGLGWDIDSPYSSNRGELFPIGSYGHTGFTGTSMWIDPFGRSYLIILTNAVHPHRGHSITSLRSRVATIVAASFGITAPSVKLTGYNETIVGPGLHHEVEPKANVLTGLDVLSEDNFAALRGKRIGLITNQTGVSRDGRRNIDLMLAAGIQVTALFSPEHGLAGAEDRSDISDTKDPASGLPVFSLYKDPSHPRYNRRCWITWMLWSSISRMSARDFTPTPARCFTAWRRLPKDICHFLSWTAQIRSPECTQKVPCWTLTSTPSPVASRFQSGMA